MTTALEPQRILRELSALWVGLSKNEEHAVLRACSMTLILVVDDGEDPARAGETLGELMHEHPSRAIVVRIRKQEREPLLESRVFAQCWMPFGRQQQICCEQIEITASPSSLQEVPPVLLGLTVADLPVILICADPELCLLPGFRELLPLATKAVFDSTGAQDPAAMLRLIAGSASPDRTVADLAWARLSRLREPVARVFDAPDMRALLPAINRVTVVHRSGPAPAGARYLAAWLSQGAPPIAAVNLLGGAPEPDVQSCSLNGEDASIFLRVAENDLLELEVNGTLKRISRPMPPECEYLRSELGILGRDAAFEHALAQSKG